jgi:MFS family permease
MKRLLHTWRGSVWRHRDLRIAGPGRALSLLGDEIALVALLLHVHDVRAGEAGVVALLAAAAIPTLLLAPWAGRLADHADSRLLVVASAVAQAAVCVALAFAGPLWLVLALVALLQVGQSVASPTWQALVPRIVGEAEVGRAIGATQALMTVAAVAGAPLGGLLSGLGGQRLPLLADALTFAVLACAGAAVRTRRGAASDLPSSATSAADGAPRAHPLEGLRVVRADILLLPIFVALMVYIVVGEATNVVEVFLVRDALHGSSVQYGLVGMAASAGIVVGSLLAGRVDGTPARTVTTVVAAAAQAAALLTAGLAPSVAALLGVYAALGIANGALNTATSTLVMTRVPDAVRGRVGAALAGLSRGFSVAALVLGGVVGTALGPARTFVLSGALALAVAGWLALVALPRRRADAPAGSEPDDEPADCQPDDAPAPAQPPVVEAV